MRPRGLVFLGSSKNEILEATASGDSSRFKVSRIARATREADSQLRDSRSERDTVALKRVLKLPKYCPSVIFPSGALSRPSAAIEIASVWDSKEDLPSSLFTFPFLRARVITPDRRATSASPDEIHCSEAEGDKSCFNFFIELFVNFHREISEVANKKGGGPVAGTGRTINGGGGAVALDLLTPTKNRPGL